jgi:ketosteroid isomerase-like protein
VSQAEVLEANRKLLATIDKGDWSAYAALCDESITCFEPEANGHLASGLPFHKYYFDLPGSPTPRLSSIASPHVRMLGETGAVVSYVRLVQKLVDGSPVTVASDETRVWQKTAGGWKHVHFHRSPC